VIGMICDTFHKTRTPDEEMLQHHKTCPLTARPLLSELQLLLRLLPLLMLSRSADDGVLSTAVVYLQNSWS
jgi:hypothetical protein